MNSPERSARPLDDLAKRVHRWLTLLFVLILAVELVVAIVEQLWLTAFLVCAITLILLAPTLLSPRIGVQIPAEYQILTIIFVFAALFLGEIRSYYDRIWWWDIALHASSGLLLGILGFLLVYVLNESDQIDVQLKPRFLAIFAFLFAVATGALWEIFEFSMDQLFGMRMQKTMLGDDSGLTDTMWDLIVDALGGAIVSVLGWWSLVQRKRLFTQGWIEKFVDRNPHLFEN